MFIVTKTIDSENISKVCRTCLREDNDKMVCLFIGPAESSLGAKLQSLSCLEISQGDGLPERMCDRCVTRAESALLFREQCRAADQALRQAAIRVSKAKNYQQQNSNFVPISHSPNDSKYPDCRIFTNHQELYHLHPPFYEVQENSEHMHVIQSANTYLNLSRYNNDSLNFVDKRPSCIASNELNSYGLTRHNSIYNRASCALQCSLCNYTFTNRTQLENHSIAHNSENVDVSSDEINIEVEDNSNQIERNVSYERSLNQSVENSIETLSYDKISLLPRDEFQNSTFTTQTHESGYKKINEVNSSAILLDLQNLSKESSCKILRSNHYKCDICSRIFNQKSKLLSHKVSHSRNKPFECIHCGKLYSSKNKLTAHIRLHTRTNIHQCHVCQKIFSYPSYLNEHMKSHDTKSLEEKVNNFECIECKKQFHFIKSYKRHMKFHTGKGLFHCDICDKLFSQKYSLKVHMRSHAPSRFYKCSLCQKSFNQKSNLVEHTRTHTKIKPFKCKICDKSFAQSSHLKSHEASHDSVRKFQCRICGKRFKLASHLKRHVNLHTGLKTYKCNQCNQTFSQAFSLKRHSKSHFDST